MFLQIPEYSKCLNSESIHYSHYDSWDKLLIFQPHLEVTRHVLYRYYVNKKKMENTFNGKKLCKNE